MISEPRPKPLVRCTFTALGNENIAVVVVAVASVAAARDGDDVDVADADDDGRIDGDCCIVLGNDLIIAVANIAVEIAAGNSLPMIWWCTFRSMDAN